MLSYILDDLEALGVREVVFVVGYLQDTIRAWIAEEYPELTPRYVVQEVQDGTAGAVALAEPYVDEDVFIIFADAVLEVDYDLAHTMDSGYAGVIWAKEVEDYQRYGVIVTNDDGTMARIVEKPSEPISRLANIGLYYIRDHALLFEGIHAVLDAPSSVGGEYYLTDAFQYMVDKGARILTAPVEGWWDAGKPETLLETNAHMVATSRGGVDATAKVEGSEIVEPVRIEAGVVVRDSRVGPNVTLEAGCVVTGSTLRDCVVGRDAEIEDSTLHDAILGGHCRIRGMTGSLSVTDHSVVDGG